METPTGRIGPRWRNRAHPGLGRRLGALARVAALCGALSLVAPGLRPAAGDVCCTLDFCRQGEVASCGPVDLCLGLRSDADACATESVGLCVGLAGYECRTPSTTSSHCPQGESVVGCSAQCTPTCVANTPTPTPDGPTSTPTPPPTDTATATATITATPGSFDLSFCCQCAACLDAGGSPCAAAPICLGAYDVGSAFDPEDDASQITACAAACAAACVAGGCLEVAESASAESIVIGLDSACSTIGTTSCDADCDPHCQTPTPLVSPTSTGTATATPTASGTSTATPTATGPTPTPNGGCCTCDDCLIEITGQCVGCFFSSADCEIACAYLECTINQFIAADCGDATTLGRDACVFGADIGAAEPCVAVTVTPGSAATATPTLTATATASATPSSTATPTATPSPMCTVALDGVCCNCVACENAEATPCATPAGCVGVQAGFVDCAELCEADCVAKGGSLCNAGFVARYCPQCSGAPAACDGECAPSCSTTPATDGATATPSATPTSGAGGTTATPAQSPTATADPACAPGCVTVEESDACWCLGAINEDCDDVCGGAGLTCDEDEIRDFAGSAGSNAHCVAVLDALGAAGSSVTTANFITDDAVGWGCLIGTNDLRVRITLPVTTCASDVADNVLRACGCFPAATETPTLTPTIAEPSATATPSSTPSETRTATATATATASATPTATAIATATASATPSATPTATASATPTTTDTPLPTATPPDTATPTVTDTPTATPTVTSTLTPTRAADGAACLVPSDCVSGYCADGVCCDRACTGPLEVCDLAPSAGTCTQRAPAPLLTPSGLLVGAALLIALGGLGISRRRAPRRRQET